jgi:hypothetical protein
MTVESGFGGKIESLYTFDSAFWIANVKFCDGLIIEIGF